MSIEVTEEWQNVRVRVKNIGLLVGDRNEDMTLSRVGVR